MEELLGLDATTAVVITGMVMGASELIKRLFAKDWQTAAVIAVSALIGGVSGAFLGLMPLQGIAFGLSASGYITLVQHIGRGATANAGKSE